MNKQQLEQVLDVLKTDFLLRKELHLSGALVSDKDVVAGQVCAIETVKQAIADYDKQEAVAEVLPFLTDEYSSTTIEVLEGVELKVGDKLYLHPQLKRVPMSDAQIEAISKVLDVTHAEKPFKENGELDADKYSLNVYRVLVRAIEKHHGVTE